MSVMSLWLSSPCFIQEDVCFLQWKAQSDVIVEENKTDLHRASLLQIYIDRFHQSLTWLIKPKPSFVYL